MYSETPALRPIRPRRHAPLMDQGQLDLIKSSTLELLKDVGVHCPSVAALKIYQEHGGEVDFHTGIVKLPPDVVMKAMSAAPRYYTMGGRTNDFDVVLDGKAFYIATDGTGTETIDYKTHQRSAPVGSAQHQAVLPVGMVVEHHHAQAVLDPGVRISGVYQFFLLAQVTGTQQTGLEGHFAQRLGLDAVLVLDDRCLHAPQSQETQRRQPIDAHRRQHRRQVHLPVLEKGILIPMEQRAPDVLAKDAAVLVLDDKVLLETRCQPMVAVVRTDADDAIGVVRPFSSLKEQVDAIWWDSS